MRTRLLALALALPAALSAYSYYVTDSFTSINTTNWTMVGSQTPSANGLTSPGVGFGKLISALPVPDGTAEYELNGTLRIQGNTTQATFRFFFRYQNDSNTYFAQFIINRNGTSCTTTPTIVRISGGVWSYPQTGWSMNCFDGMAVRTIVRGTRVVVFVGATLLLDYNSVANATGVAGFGVELTDSGVSLQLGNLGALDRTAPTVVTNITGSAQPNRVDLQWTASTDGSGVGVWRYAIYRNGVWTAEVDSAATTWTDYAVTPSTAYTYTIYATDLHQNTSTGATYNISTPGGGPAYTQAPSRTGVRPFGAYWGASPEQIDMLSGNLNWSMPLIRPSGRGGLSVPITLSYNSQLWRLDSGATYKPGRDVGYGFGWRLMPGSITPIWSDPQTISYYLFTDSSGAEYRLDVQSGNYWMSKEGLYLGYKPSDPSGQRRLYFPNGTYWVMGCESGGTEPDIGTLYPTLIQDSNGNQILINYKVGGGLSTHNTSARIDIITDVRGNAYQFYYNADSPVPHLTSINGTYGATENYSFTYSGYANLASPFNGGTGWGQAKQLSSVTNALGLAHAFTIASSGEMTKVTLPYGGEIEWLYRTFTFTGSKSIREVYERRLRYSTGAAQKNYTITRDDSGDASRSLHAWALLNDPDGQGKKYWEFSTATDWTTGLLTKLEGRENSTVLQRATNTWTRDSQLNPYLATMVGATEPASANVQTKTEQTVNSYGQLLETKIYHYGTAAPGALARVFTNTYLSTSAYVNDRFIRNRVLTSTVTQGAQSVTTTNTYDGNPSVADRPGLTVHDTANYGPAMIQRGLVTRATAPNKVVNLSYDITGMQTSASDDSGHIVNYTPENGTNNAVLGSSQIGSLQTQIDYNGWLGVTSVISPNNATTSLQYDSYTRPSQTTSPHGAITTFAYTNSPPTQTATTNGKWAKTTMDGLGRTIKVETGYATTTVSVVDTEYDSCACSPLGKVKRVSQPYVGSPSYWTEYIYDGLGRTKEVRLPTNGAPASKVTYTYAGNTVTTTDPAGKWKKHTTDALGNLTHVNEPNPQGVPFTPIRVNAGSTTAYTDPSTNVWSADTGYTGGWTNSTGCTITNTTTPTLYQTNRDGMSQYQYTVPNGSYSVTLKFAEIYYGYPGSRVFNVVINGTAVETNFDIIAAAGAQCKAHDRTYNVTATGGVITIQFQQVTSYPTVNAIEITGGGSGGADYITNYTYDLLNRLTQVSMPRPTGTQTRIWTYNTTTQRLTSVSQPENGTTSYTYNADGSVATKTDAKGQKTEYTYDATYGRVTTIKRKPNGTTEDPCQQTNFNYGATPGTSTNGRLSSVTWGGTTCAITGNRAFTESYSYTPAGATTSKTLSASIPSGAISLVASYTYDNEGKMTSVKYPDTRNDGGPSGLVTGPTYTYGFDPLGQPNSLTDGTTQWVSYAHYTVAGQLDQLRYLQTGGQYWQETRAYNERLQLTRITNKNYITGSQTPFFDEQYFFTTTANNGRIESKLDHVAQEHVGYSYDSLNRLSTAWTSNLSWAIAWGYDGFGNRQSQTTTAGSGPPNSSVVVDPATNRLTGSSNYQYDANGNMTRMPASTTFATMTYDVDNRIVTAADPTSGTDSYAYAPDNKRIWKKKPNGTEEFYFYGVGGQKLGTYQISTAGQQGYPPYFADFSTELYFGARKIRSQGQAIAIDRLGSVRYTGAGVTRRYFPYGEEQVVSTNDQDKFGTYFRDLTTGLDYAVNRYHLPTLGRFSSADPYQTSKSRNSPDEWNRYSYVAGDPVNYFDPKGLIRLTSEYCKEFPTDPDCEAGDEPWNCARDGESKLLPAGCIVLPIVTPKEAQEPKEPPCDAIIELATIPLPVSFSGLAGRFATHSFIRISSSTGIPGILGVGTTFLEGVESFRNQNNAPLGLPNQTFLNQSKAGGPYYGTGYPTTVHWNSREAGVEHPCGLAAALLARSSLFRNWTLRYRKLGPNSNSYAHWLLRDEPETSNISAPRGAIGWDDDDKIPF